MRSTTRPVLVSLGLVLAASAALAAGSVQVSYVKADDFADIGHSPYDRQLALQQLTRHFETLASRHLADGQSLTIDVLDVDLAGELRPSARTGYEIRVLRGKADWPRITLRYTLTSGGQAARSGEQQIADMNYLRHISRIGDDEALHAEKHMLEAWFAAQHFDAGAAR